MPAMGAVIAATARDPGKNSDNEEWPQSSGVIAGHFLSGLFRDQYLRWSQWILWESQNQKFIFRTTFIWKWNNNYTKWLVVEGHFSWNKMIQCCHSLKGQTLFINNTPPNLIKSRHTQAEQTNVIHAKWFADQWARPGPEWQCGSPVVTPRRPNAPQRAAIQCAASLSFCPAQRRYWLHSQSPRVPSFIAIYSLVHPWQINRWFQVKEIGFWKNWGDQNFLH